MKNENNTPHLSTTIMKVGERRKKLFSIPNMYEKSHIVQTKILLYDF